MAFKVFERKAQSERRMISVAINSEAFGMDIFTRFNFDWNNKFAELSNEIDFGSSVVGPVICFSTFFKGREGVFFTFSEGREEVEIKNRDDNGCSAI